MTTAFNPKHFPRTCLPGRRVLSDAQQYQYDVLRTVGGKLIKANGWYREVPYADANAPSAIPEGVVVREKIYGLNLVAMFKLVAHGLVTCVADTVTGGYLFLLPELAKNVPGQRYDRVNHVVQESP